MKTPLTQPFFASLLFVLALLAGARSVPAQIRMRGITTNLDNTADRFLSLDLNGDGKSDLLYSRPGGGFAAAYLSHGDGTFRQVDYVNSGTGYNGFPGNLSSSKDTFVALDLNGDGKSDFIEYRPGSGYTFACLSVGDGSVNCETLSPGNAFGFNDSMTQGNEHIVALDLNGDGKSDFIVYAPGGGFAHAYLSKGDGTLTEVTLNGFLQGDLNASDAVITSLDVNHDGRADLLVSAPTIAGGVLRLYLNQGNNTFSRFDLSDGVHNHDGFMDNAADANSHIIALDLNGDGNSDFLWWQAGSPVVTGYTSRGDGTFNYVPYQTANGGQHGFRNTTNYPTDTAVAVNLDATGYTGFLWYTPGQGNVVAYHSSSTGTLTPQILVADGANKNGFEDRDLLSSSTALAVNFRGYADSGAFFWYAPGNSSLLQAYEDINGASFPLNSYSFTTYPSSYLADLNWSIGNVPLKEVVMLGTHDSAMYGLNGGTGDTSETQYDDVPTQLTDGARVFDFRSGYYLLDPVFNSCCIDLTGSVQNLDTANPRAEGFYMFGHSSTLTDYSPFTLISQVEDWLAQNPSEVAILDMNNTHGGKAGGFENDNGSVNYGPLFAKTLLQTDRPDLLYTPVAACGQLTCPAKFNPQNVSINYLKSLGTRLILIDIPGSITGVGWESSLRQGGYCSQYGAGGNSAAHSEIDCINNGDSVTPSLSSIRGNFEAGAADTQFFGLKANLTPFGEVEPNGDVINSSAPLTLCCDSSKAFNTGPDKYDLPAQLANGAWSINALNLVYLDGLGLNSAENQIIARNNQTWLDTSFFNRTFPQSASAIAASPDGTAWAAGAGHSTSIFQYNPNRGGTWTAKINGEPNVKKLAADAKGGIWVVEQADGSAGPLVYYDTNGNKTTTQSVVQDVAVGADNSVWAIGVNGSLFNVQAGTTVQPSSIPAQAGVHLAIDNQGYPWVVQSNGFIERFNGTGWAQVTGTQAKEIAISPEGSVFITGLNQASVARLNRGGNAFDFLVMDAKHITVDSTGHPWAIRQATGAVYKGALDQM